MVIQRVKRASVRVESAEVGAIGPGCVIFLGVAREDTVEDVSWLVSRVVKLRLFESAPGRMDCDLGQVGGEALVVSQFTLFGSLKKGNRPSFNRAAPPETARELYAEFVAQLAAAMQRPVPTGRFGADMEIEMVQDGPVTLLVDSRDREL